MTFDTLNTSTEDGAPIDLITFNVGSETFRFTNAEDELTVLSLTYEPIAISRDPVELGIEARTQTVSARMPADHPFAVKYLGVPPGRKTTGVIQVVHRDDLTDVRTEFTGLLRSVGFDQLGAEAEIIMLPLTGALLRVVPRFLFSGMCNHVLYDGGCGVNRSSFTHTGVGATTADSQIITVSGIDAAKGVGWATGGYCEFNNDARGVFRHIATNQLVLVAPFKESIAGQTISVYAGCDHEYGGDCAAVGSGGKFNNQARFGGFPFVPTKNPFIGKINQQ